MNVVLSLHPLKIGYPGPLRQPLLLEGSWRVMEVAEHTSNAMDRWILADIGALGSTSDTLAMRKSLIAFSERAATGRPLRDLYDEKQLHEITQCNGTKVLRIWGTGKSRILFVYGKARQLIIVRLFAKRTNLLTSGEEQAICSRVAHLYIEGILS